MKQPIRLICAVGLLVALQLPALVLRAQQGGTTNPQTLLNNLAAAGLVPPPDTTALNQLYANLEPAELIGPSLLGVNSTSVSRPGGIQDISVSLVRSFVNLPTTATGVGVEFSPLQLLEQTKVESIAGLPRQGADLLKTFVPQYRALEDYRRSFWGRGFTVSGASVGDSIQSRLAAGISYTFGAGQLDPYKARRFMEDVTAGITKRLNPAATEIGAELQTYAKILGDEIIRSCQQASVPDITRDELLDELSSSRLIPGTGKGSPLRVPQVGGSAVVVIDADSVRAALLFYLEKKPSLTATQREQLLKGLSATAIPAYLTLRATIARSLNPVFSDVKLLVGKATEEFERNNWNASLLQLGAGQVWASPNHTWSALSRQSVHGFLRAAVRPPNNWGSISHHAQLIANLQYAHYSADAMALQSRFSYGTRVLLGNQKARLSADCLWQTQAYRTIEGVARATETLSRWTIGAELQVVDNLWFEVAFGKGPPVTDTGLATSSAGVVTLGGLKYGFRNRRRFVVN